MKISDIAREPVRVIDVAPLDDVIAAAREVLNYTPRVATETEVKKQQLAKVLHDLEIVPLAVRDVKLYQIERLAEMWRERVLTRLGDDTFWWNLRYFGEWSMTEIEKYSEPIPEFVLNKAIQIKRACPDVAVFVEWLNDHPDPFLVVRLGTETRNAELYYIEAWDEPRFEGRLTR